MAFSFSSIIPPKLMLGIVRQKLEEQLNEHFKTYNPSKVPFVVTEYVTLIDFKQNRIDFLVEGNKYPMADFKKFMDVAREAIIEKIGEVPIEMLAINYVAGSASFFGKGKETKITATVAYNKDGKTIHETHIL